jgi:hypothetical protein
MNEVIQFEKWYCQNCGHLIWGKSDPNVWGIHCSNCSSVDWQKLDPNENGGIENG